MGLWIESQWIEWIEYIYRIPPIPVLKDHGIKPWNQLIFSESHAPTKIIGDPLGPHQAELVQLLSRVQWEGRMEGLVFFFHFFYVQESLKKTQWCWKS
jgi:hypothetical protein